MKIEKPGIYTMPAEDYHADPCPAPSLSSSIAGILLSESPRHAKAAHPKLNPNLERDTDQKFVLGTACHAHLLEGETAFVVIDADDWRTKAAKEQRDAAHAAGRTPLLKDQWATVQAMARAVKEQLDQHRDGPRPFSAGKPEQTVVWFEEGVWCRARLDWLFDDFTVIDDFKSTGASAHPMAWPRTAYGMNADVQVAWYRRGVRAVTGVDPLFRFVVAENYEPYAASVISLDPGALAVADRKVQRAIEIWSECLERDEWPGYPHRTCYVEIPAYEEAAWIAREERELEGVA